MKSVLLATIILLVSFAALAQSDRATPSPPTPVAAREVHRDFALEAAVQDRSQKIAAFIHPKSKAKLDGAARALVRRLAIGSENQDPLPLAKQEVLNRFGRLSAEQLNLLSFFVMAEASKILSQPDQAHEKLSGMNEMSEMTSLRLQMTMDRRSKFISTLSNLMKKISTTQDTIVQNLK